MRILVIEDEQRVAGLLQKGLEEQGFSVTLAFDGEAGKKLACSGGYDLIITDIILPKISGVDLCKQIRAQFPKLPIIMLTALGSTDNKVEGFDAGADDYMVKPFDLRELYVRIRALLKRNTSEIKSSEQNVAYADLRLNNDTKTVFRSGIEISLTPKELKLLEYMIENKERLLTRAEIAEKVWDTHFDTGTNFIDVYINYLRKKIDKNFPDKLIHTKPGLGFIFKHENTQ